MFETKSKTYYTLSALQELLMRKLAKKYSNPYISIKVTKSNKYSNQGFWVRIKGNHLANEMSFFKEVKENNFQEYIL